jgi:hypothetical protein
MSRRSRQLKLSDRPLARSLFTRDGSLWSNAMPLQRFDDNAFDDRRYHQYYKDRGRDRPQSETSISGNPCSHTGNNQRDQKNVRASKRTQAAKID